MSTISRERHNYDMTKLCLGCNQVKNEIDFAFRTDTGKYRNYCLSCQKEYHKQYHKNWYQQNKQKRQKQIKNYNVSHKVQLGPYRKEWRKENRKREYERDRKRSLTDLNFKIKRRLRDRVSKIVTLELKSGSAVRDLGCSVEDFRKHLEAKFYINPKNGEQMSWQNYGRFGWHIDHIIPLCSFDLTNLEQFKKAAHYTNLQPLWWFENLSKNATIGVKNE